MHINSTFLKDVLKSWINKGIITISDIYDIDSKLFIMFTALKAQHNLKTKQYFYYQKVKSCIKTTICKNYATVNADQYSFYYKVNKINRKNITKTLSDIQLKQIPCHKEKYQVKREDNLNFNWEQINITPFRLTKATKLQNFQYNLQKHRYQVRLLSY